MSIVFVRLAKALSCWGAVTHGESAHAFVSHFQLFGIRPSFYLMDPRSVWCAARSGAQEANGEGLPGAQGGYRFDGEVSWYFLLWLSMCMALHPNFARILASHSRCLRSGQALDFYIAHLRVLRPQNKRGLVLKCSHFQPAELPEDSDEPDLKPRVRQRPFRECMAFFAFLHRQHRPDDCVCDCVHVQTFTHVRV